MRALRQEVKAHPKERKWLQDVRMNTRKEEMEGHFSCPGGKQGPERCSVGQSLTFHLWCWPRIQEGLGERSLAARTPTSTQGKRGDQKQPPSKQRGE